MTGPLKKYEYINDYLYFVVRQAPERGSNAWVYCSGVNITRFSTLTRGRHGLSSNPVIRGLQLLKHNVSRLAISHGARPRLIRGRDCSGIAPTQEAWYSEILLVEDAPASLPAGIIALCTEDLFEKIIVSCCPEMKHPGRPLAPEELQTFIAGLSPRA
ncbi:MAG: hypothetical protein HZB31_05205 [Nitrospirae bacterium]|nr:hypothetical protein [Nitrospirota bacterium]